MRALIVWLLALSYGAVPVLGRDSFSATGHGLTRRVPSGAPAKAALPVPDQRLAQAGKTPAAQSETVGAEAAPVKPEVSPTPAASASAPASPAVVPADPGLAVDDALRETHKKTREKLAPPDEEKAIDFALRPFDDRRDRAPAREGSAPSQSPAAQAGPPSPLSSGGPKNGNAP
jgi:hypothetical protein